MTAPANPPAEPIADLCVWAAMELLDAGWSWPDIATALDRSLDWLQEEVTRLAVFTTSPAAGPPN